MKLAVLCVCASISAVAVGASSLRVTSHREMVRGCRAHTLEFTAEQHIFYLHRSAEFADLLPELTAKFADLPLKLSNTVLNDACLPVQKNGDFNAVFVSLNMGSTTPDTDAAYMAGKLLEHKLTAAMVTGADAIAIGIQELDKPLMDADGVFNTMCVVAQPFLVLTFSLAQCGNHIGLLRMLDSVLLPAFRAPLVVMQHRGSHTRGAGQRCYAPAGFNFPWQVQYCGQGQCRGE